jgi:HD domain
MSSLRTLLGSAAFQADFARLGAVTLDPSRHSTPNARTHSEAVAKRARALAVLNGYPPADADLLEAAGLVHDIGKIGGTTGAAASVERLPLYGIDDARLTELVRYHDVSLSWFLASERGRGDPPGEKAWRKLAARLEPRLLVPFMVADRVDCPGGWRANEPVVWFVEALRRRGLLPSGMVLDAVEEGTS